MLYPCHKKAYKSHNASDKYPTNHHFVTVMCTYVHICNFLNHILYPCHRQAHKSHNVSDKYPTMHHFITDVCTYVHISVMKWHIMGYGTGALWDYAPGKSIKRQ